MKKFLSYSLTVALFFSSVTFTSAKKNVTMHKTGITSETTFAIITDNTTFENCTQALLSYKNILENEGLGTYVIHSEWNSPEEIRNILKKLYGRKSRLEGAVFVGDVPVVMVREAQYLTTAFKMNEQAFPIFESSVPSDRFYDDFDMEFEFLTRDSTRNDVFYYRLSETGSQKITPDIYSARIKVPGVMEGDKYAILNNYLEKVVKAHEENDRLDAISYFAGHGYNSDCLTVWRQKPLVFREYFPEAFTRSSRNRFLNFRQNGTMKYNLMNELQRNGTDLFIFSEHGAFDTQYINETGAASNLEECTMQLKRAIAGMYEEYKGTDEDEDFLREVLDSVYFLPREALSDSAVAMYSRLDSAEWKNANIFLDDIMEIKSNPKVLVFNACYNGSFHRNDGYVAGCHIFGDGGSIVAQGNTVNVLQDKWEDKLIGLLRTGERIGMWQKEVSYLESHLCGDPTFRFSAPDTGARDRLHHELIFEKDNADLWTGLLDSESPLIRSVAVTRLGEIGDGHSEIIYGKYMTDDSWIVRQHCLNAIAGRMDDYSIKIIEAAFADPYEAIVRAACRYAGASGYSGFIPFLEKVGEENPEMIRAAFSAEGSLDVLSEESSMNDYVTVMEDRNASEKKRINAMRMFRNNRNSKAIAGLKEILADPDETDAVREVAAEVLGWYDNHIGKESISDSLESFLKTGKNIPENIRKETVKTIKRLRNI